MPNRPIRQQLFAVALYSLVFSAAVYLALLALTARDASVQFLWILGFLFSLASVFLHWHFTRRPLTPRIAVYVAATTLLVYFSCFYTVVLVLFTGQFAISILIANIIFASLLSMTDGYLLRHCRPRTKDVALYLAVAGVSTALIMAALNLDWHAGASWTFPLIYAVVFYCYLACSSALTVCLRGGGVTSRHSTVAD